MEQEFKWHLPADRFDALMQYLRENGELLSAQTLRMEAVYYETVDGLLYRLGVALRIRRENDRSICCLKRTVHKEGALAQREEYETEADSLAEGFARLPDAGAPADLCRLLAAQTFTELARTRFTRQATLFRFRMPEPFTAEFAADSGALGGAGKMSPFSEIELELKSGDAASFFRFADALAEAFSLIPQPASKLARAIRTARQGGEPHETD
ncbi:MAG: CYTH domain-containing protein [Oscillospiraceae bacterium]|nr:CYTH domain-containing protein [Oscillospiraceae bacterium]